jgi:hemerythrin-like metal-binding protein
MDFVTWTSEMSVGVTTLDDDHKVLIGIINQLHFGIMAGHDRAVLSSVLDQLVDYTKFHFLQEETLFAKANYLGAPAHKLEHDGFIDRIENLRTRSAKAPVAMIDLELMGFLRTWLVTHIMVSDMKYGPRLNAVGIF